MSMINKLDAALNFHQTALRIRNQRQEILASNIANADTPHYKARDIDFAASLSAALETGSNAAGSAMRGSNTATTLHTTQSGHLPGTAAVNEAGASASLLFRPVLQGAVDGNSVDMDVERNAFVDNGIRYEASLSMINGQIKKMLTAITGQ